MPPICSFCQDALSQTVLAWSGVRYYHCGGCGSYEQVGTHYEARRLYEKAQKDYVSSLAEGAVFNKGVFSSQEFDRFYYIRRTLSKRPARIAEVGPGKSQLWKLVKNLSTDYHLIEAEPGVCTVPKSSGVKVHLCKLEQLPLEFTFDFVFSFHVLEHVENIEAHVARMLEMLDQQGLGMIAMPNAKSLESRLFKGKGPDFDPAHLRIASPIGISLLLERMGARILKVETLERPSDWPRFITSFIRRLQNQDSRPGGGHYMRWVDSTRLGRWLFSAFVWFSWPARAIQARFDVGSELRVVFERCGARARNHIG